MKLPLWVIVLVYLTCWPAAALADPTLKAENGDTLELKDAPCEDASILAYIVQYGAGEKLTEFKQARLIYRGQELKSCWIDVDGWVYSVDDQGDKMEKLPRRLFLESTI